MLFISVFSLQDFVFVVLIFFICRQKAMRDFYDKKLKEMGTLLEEKELETEKLSDELKKIDTNHVRGKELKDRLREKQQQVAALKKKQAELTRLTTVASKNQTQIEKLRKEVTDMKHKKVDLQKIITSERKNHAAEVQKLKKQSLQKDRELNKVKRASDRKAIEAQKAQQIAKSRLDQINYLKSKFKDTEKRQRMTTVKRGVMNKAGVDPIMVGRRQPKSNSRIVKANGKNAGVDVDTLRDFFDQKVADMGRKESLAEKLAQEWEAHFELTSSREELRKEGYEESGESIQSLDSQIQYKKERIRQLASRLGKRRMGSDDSKRADAYLFDQKFRDIVGSKLNKMDLVPSLSLPRAGALLNLHFFFQICQKQKLRKQRRRCYSGWLSGKGGVLHPLQGQPLLWMNASRKQRPSRLRRTLPFVHTSTSRDWKLPPSPRTNRSISFL